MSPPHTRTARSGWKRPTPATQSLFARQLPGEDTATHGRHQAAALIPVRPVSFKQDEGVSIGARDRVEIRCGSRRQHSSPPVLGGRDGPEIPYLSVTGVYQAQGARRMIRVCFNAQAPIIKVRLSRKTPLPP